MRVPGTGTGGTSTGSAGLYPITFTVSGMGAIVTEVFLSLSFGTLAGTAGVLNNEEHTLADDLDMMLLSPTGVQLMFFSDAGGANDMNGTYVFRDGFASMHTSGSGQNLGGNIVNGTYGVSQYQTSDVFLSPAPSPSYANTTFAAFNGSNPNGVWSLYVMDDSSANAGWIMSSTLTVAAVPEPASLAILGLGAAALLRRRRS